MNTARLLHKVITLQSTIKNINWRVLDDARQYQLVMMERKLQSIQKELSTRINGAPGRRDLTPPFYLGQPPGAVDPRPVIYRGARAV